MLHIKFKGKKRSEKYFKWKNSFNGEDNGKLMIEDIERKIQIIEI